MIAILIHRRFYNNYKKLTGQSKYQHAIKNKTKSKNLIRCFDRKANTYESNFFIPAVKRVYYLRLSLFLIQLRYFYQANVLFCV